MPTIATPESRAALLARVGKLTPESRPNWGTLSAPRLLCHLADQLRVALGEIPAQQRGNWRTHTLLKWIVIYMPVQAPPGKVQTVPEMLTTSPRSWIADLASLETLLERLAVAERTAPHPVFGRLSHSEWCRLAWKHFNHHLGQFGV
ncbi:MAG: DUF1569 domain-containing protein [Gemmatimonadota bacterium]